MRVTIRLLETSDLPAFNTHFARHRAESGNGGLHFMPFSPNDPHGPNGLNPEGLALSLDQLGWQRWIIALDADEVVGHVDLKGDGLKTGLHRCELGIGIEAAYRGQGLGKRLMGAAIDYAAAATSIDWVDLKTFAHNTHALALYRKLGFIEQGTVVDRFRIEGASIDDVIMTLRVTSC